MSLFELLVVFIVGLLLLKPEDMPKVISKITEFKSFITNTKKEIISHIDPELKEDIKPQSKEETKRMNYFLEKIIQLEGEYNGDYTIKDLKAHYNKLIAKKIKDEKE